MISQSKGKQRHSSGQKRVSFEGSNPKYHFNQTIYQNKKKSYQIGADLGFDDEKMKNVDKATLQYRQPYLKRVVFHWRLKFMFVYIYVVPYQHVYINIILLT